MARPTVRKQRLGSLRQMPLIIPSRSPTTLKNLNSARAATWVTPCGGRLFGREVEVFCIQRLAKAFIGANSKEFEDAPFAATEREHRSEYRRIPAPGCLIGHLWSP